MTVKIEDVLGMVCSRVEHVPSHNFQKIFLLGNEKEAQVACDILVTHGFGAKLYRENGDSRLYVAQIADPAAAEQSLASALSYAHMLKTVQNSLELLQKNNPDNPQYSISMRNVSAQDKAISIHLVTPAKIQLGEKPLTEAVAEAAESAPKAVLKAPAPAGKKKTAPQDQFMAAGPQLTQESWLARYYKSQRKGPDGLFRRLTLYIFGNAASAGYIIGVVLLFLLVIYSFMVLSKAVFCPDFVKAEKEKSRSWYCSHI